MRLHLRYLVVISILLLFLFTVTPSRYDYLWFENFELTKNTFVEEQELVGNLEIFRNDLTKQIGELSRIIKYNSHRDYCVDKNKEMGQNLIDSIRSDAMNISNFIGFRKTILLNTDKILA